MQMLGAVNKHVLVLHGGWRCRGPGGTARGSCSPAGSRHKGLEAEPQAPAPQEMLFGGQPLSKQAG